MTTKDEALKALHEASLSIACLGADWYDHFEDWNNDINYRMWDLQYEKGLQKDIDHIQDQITILENYLNPHSTYNPYAPKEETNV